MSATGHATRLTDLDALKAALHRALLDDPVPPHADRTELRSRLAALLDDAAPLLGPERAGAVLDELVDEVDGLGPLEPLLADPEVTEIMVNGPGRAYVERRGALEPIGLDLDAASIRRLAERVVAPLGLRLDRAAPVVDARLPDGSRLHAVLPPLAPDGPCLTIRRFAASDLALDDFGVVATAAAACRAVADWRWNLLVAGATSTGKTTLLNALGALAHPSERILTIEETPELRLPQPHVVRLVARAANAEGVGAVDVRELVRAALRMRPDRIVVGEVRGPEALDLLQALNTGHDGSLATVHANGPADALSRLETLALLARSGLPLGAVRAQVAGAIDAVVHVRRAAHGARVVGDVAEVGTPPVEGAPWSLRPLLGHVGGRLVVRGDPTRPPRRAGVGAPMPAWPSWS